MADYNDLQYSPNFWRDKLGEKFAENLKKEDKLHLILSLIIFLATPFYEVLYFMFSSQLPSVQSRATSFMKPFKESGTHTTTFGGVGDSSKGAVRTRFPRNKELYML
jgi:hypothetical protein